MKGFLILVLLGYLLLTFILFAGSMTAGGIAYSSVITLRTVLGLFAVADVIAIIALASSDDEVPTFSACVLLAPAILLVGSSVKSVFVS